jgi:hypothetical protein
MKTLIVIASIATMTVCNHSGTSGHDVTAVIACAAFMTMVITMARGIAQYLNK